MPDREDVTYTLPRPMTGDEIRSNLQRHMLASWYQDRVLRIQIGGAAVAVYFPSSLEELALYSPECEWTKGIVGSEYYTALRFPGDYAHLFARTPDQW